MNLIGLYRKPFFYSGSDVEKIIGFIQHFISISLKSNQYVELVAFINSCVRLNGVLSDGLNNIDYNQ